MKTRMIITALLVFGITMQTNAQFLKKLKKQAQEAAEETIKRKVGEKTERETEKTFDTVFNNKGKLLKKKKTEKIENYTFSHQYVMELISDKDTTDITYYLTNDHEYMGSSFTAGKDQEFIVVMDLPNAAIHTFMNMAENKSMSSFAIDLDFDPDTDSNGDRFSVSPTGQRKEILGYNCEEFQVTGPELSGTVWVTQEAEISVQKAFSELRSKKIKRLKGIDQTWVSMVDGIALEMVMIDYSKKKPKTIKMICTDLSERDFSINTLEYEKTF